MKILSDLRTWLDSTATKISNEEGDPERWDTPLLYLLEQLENEAERNQGDDLSYERMLHKVRDAMNDWLQDHTWGY